MNYLLDRKTKRKKVFLAIFLVIILFFLFYFRAGVGNGLSFTAHTVFKPVLVLGNTIGEKFGSIHAFFSSQDSLLKENEDLKSKLSEHEADMADYTSIVAENASLKGILDRKGNTPLTLAGILAKPNVSPYDTLVIDIGSDKSLQVGDLVFAEGNVPVGRVADVYQHSSKVTLFSNSGEKTQVVVGDKNIFLEAVGRGGGNFEIVLPRDFSVQKGDQALLPGINSYVLGVVETIISDPRDPFTKALLVSPVNIQEIKFVEVEKR